MDIKDANKSTMEIAQVPPIVSIFRHATVTFDKKKENQFSKNLEKLKLLMDGLRAEHLGFDNSLSDKSLWTKSTKAPCTYIEVYQSNKINMSIFVLKPGFKMPLHDHPRMHGLLKVIVGAVNIKSFSECPITELPSIDFKLKAKLEASRLAQSVHKRRTFFAKISNNSVCRANAETCLLTPSVSNYHEIEALEMPAAFFDILSPPYDTFIEGIGPRRCHYYKIAHEISTNIVQLQEIETPDCFFCDQAPYLGPLLT